MNNPTRIRILLPVILMVVWIALVCLAIPGFATAAEPAGQTLPEYLWTPAPSGDLRR